MPLFNVAVREHTYTGRFYSDVVQASSCEEALQAAAQHAAVSQPPPGPEPQQGSDVAVTGDTRTERLDTHVVQASGREKTVQAAATPEPPPSPAPQQGFSVVVREQAPAGLVYSAVVQASSCEEALQAAAAQAATSEPPPAPAPQVEAAGRARCADVWIYALLHCELEAGHDPPHRALAHGYGRPVWWDRDDLGVAHAVPAPANAAPVASSITQPSPAPEAEPPVAPFTGAGS
jgi:hypothetical protein